MAFCAPCGRAFVHRAALEQHLDYSEAHRYTRAYCNPCGRDFIDSAALQQHLDYSEAHRRYDERQYCGPCDRHFVNAAALNDHLDYSHAHMNDSSASYDSDGSYDSSDSDGSYDEEEAYCQTCDRYFVNDDALKQHLDHSSAHKFFNSPTPYSISHQTGTPTLFGGNRASANPHPQPFSRTAATPAVPNDPTVPSKVQRHSKSTNTPSIPPESLRRLDPNNLEARSIPAEKTPISSPNGVKFPTNSTVDQAQENDINNRIAEEITKQIERRLSDWKKDLNMPTVDQASANDLNHRTAMLAMAIEEVKRKVFSWEGQTTSPFSKTLAKDPKECQASVTQTATKPPTGIPEGLATSTAPTSQIAPAEVPSDFSPLTTTAGIKAPLTNLGDKKSSIPSLVAKDINVSIAPGSLKTRVKSEENLQCLSCKLSFQTENDLSVHINGTEDHYMCPICTRVTQFPTAKLLENHKVSTHGLCTLCDETYGNPDNLFEHDLANHNACKCCRNYFLTKDDLEMHIDISHPYQQCTGCKASFETAASMILHLELGSCPISRDKFQVKDLALDCLRSHFFAPLEDTEFPFQCSTCDAKFLMVSEFVQHVESSTCEETMDADRPVGILLQHIQSLERLWGK